MTALRDAIDYTTLGWVKPELDETLRQARIEIEAHLEDAADGASMRACARISLHRAGFFADPPFEVCGYCSSWNRYVCIIT